MHNDFERLSIQFRRSSALPQLPGSALKLISALDSEHEGGATVERIVTSDPALAAGIIRVASSSLYGRNKVSTIRGAILRVGEKSIRSLALALTMQSLDHTSQRHSLFDPYRSSRHALFVGLMASTLHAMLETTQGNLSWTAEEVLAAGILHDLHFGILVRLAPDVFGQCAENAKANGITFEDSFERLYGEPAWKLTVMAMETWGMPPVFAQSISKMHRGTANGLDSHCALQVAHYLANQVDCNLEKWSVSKAPELDDRWPLPPSEVLEEMVMVVRNESEAFLQTTLAVVA